MPTTSDPLTGDVAAEPAAPRTLWRRLTPWVAALLAVVVLVGWQVLSRNPELTAEGTTWSSPPLVTCGDDDVSLHAAADENVTDGSPLYAVLVRNSSQFPVKLSAEQPGGFRVSFTAVVDPSDAAGATPGTTNVSVSLPTGGTAWLVVSAASPPPKLTAGGSTEVEAVTLRTTTLGTSASQDLTLPDSVVLYGGTTPPDGYRCS